MAQAAGRADRVGEDADVRAGRPLDLVHLARQCLGDEGLEREVLALFDKTIAHALSRLTLSRDADETAMSLHTVRGAAAGVGAWTVASLAGAAEKELRDGGSLSTEHIQDIALAVEEVRAFIAGMIADLD